MGSKADRTSAEMAKQGDEAPRRPVPSDPEPAFRREGTPAPDRTQRDPGEGPAWDGGSGLAAEEEPAEEEIGGGD